MGLSVSGLVGVEPLPTTHYQHPEDNHEPVKNRDGPEGASQQIGDGAGQAQQGHQDGGAE